MLENLASDAEVLEKYGAPRREITLGHWITIRCRIETPVWDSRFCTGSRSDGRPGPDVGYAAAWERIAAGDHAAAQDHAAMQDQRSGAGSDSLEGFGGGGPKN